MLRDPISQPAAQVKLADEEQTRLAVLKHEPDGLCALVSNLLRTTAPLNQEGVAGAMASGKGIEFA